MHLTFQLQQTFTEAGQEFVWGGMILFIQKLAGIDASILEQVAGKKKSFSNGPRACASGACSLAVACSPRLVSPHLLRRREIGTEKEKKKKEKKRQLCGHAVVPLFVGLLYIYIPIRRSSNLSSLASIPSHHNIPSSSPSSSAT